MRILPLLVAALLAGCFDTTETYYEFDADQHYRNPGVFPGTYLYASQDGSTVLNPGPYQAGEPTTEILRSDLSAYPMIGEQSLSDGEVFIPMAIWRPENVTEPVPVIVDAGPYYEIGTHCPDNQPDCSDADRINDTIEYPSQMTPFLLRNMLPHGYAVVQLAIRGTGTAGGCMDLLGPDEQHDLVQAVEWLADQPWSNGNVGMMGVSYDGSTPWVTAASGTPALKTIVPISGLPDIYDLMFHNGSAETRGPIMYTQGYWPFGFDDEFPSEEGWAAIEDNWDPIQAYTGLPPPGRFGEANGREPYQDRHNLLCDEAAFGLAMGRATTTTGNRLAVVDDFWTARDHRQDVLENYNGSIFLIHGLQDWNVDPHAAIPFNAQLREAGLEMKEWYGQWDHTTPDGRCGKATDEEVILPCRLDYAEVLLRWFDHYLKDTPREPGPAIQVQDNAGLWRNVDAFPPEADWQDWYLSGDTLTSEPGAEQEIQLVPGLDGPTEIAVFQSAPAEEEIRISGLPQLRVPFEAIGAGEIGAWLLEDDGRGLVRSTLVGAPPDGPLPIVGHAQMNVLYHAGGEEAQVVVPGERYIAMLEFEPLDIVLPEGHSLILWVFQYHYPDHQGNAVPGLVTIFPGPDAKLRLPVIDVDPRTVFPVPGSHFPDRTDFNSTYTYLPVVPPALPIGSPASAVAATDETRGIRIAA